MVRHAESWALNQPQSCRGSFGILASPPTDVTGVLSSRASKTASGFGSMFIRVQGGKVAHLALCSAPDAVQGTRNTTPRSRMDDTRDRPGKCTNCHGLIVEELLAARGYSAEFNWWRAFDEDDCETCRLLRNGIALADPPGNHEPIRKWQLHTQNGLIMKGDDNGRALMVEFYRTSGELAVFQHLLPWVYRRRKVFLLTAYAHVKTPRRFPTQSRSNSMWCLGGRIITRCSNVEGRSSLLRLLRRPPPDQRGCSI